MLLAGAMLAASAAEAKPPSPAADGLFAVVSAVDGRCLDVEGAGAADDAGVLLWD
jgi:hypothetical protein